MKRVLVVIMALAPLALAEAKPKSTVHHDVPPGVLYLPLTPARWRVGYNGVGAFDQAQVEHTVFRTAAKLTLSQGFDWFQPIGERTEPVETKDAVDLKRPAGAARPDELYLKWGAACSSGWMFGSGPSKLCADAPAADRPFQTSTQIIMGHGPAPTNGMAFDARQAELRTRQWEPDMKTARGPWISLPHLWPF